MIHSVLTSLPNLVDQAEADLGVAGEEALTAVSLEDAGRIPKELAMPSSLYLPVDDVEASWLECTPYPTPPPEADERELGQEESSLGLADFREPMDVVSPADVSLPPSRPPSPMSPTPSLSSLVRPPKSLPALLRQADELMATYPPTHEYLKLAATFGPASVIHTWHEDAALLPSDAAAENMVIAGTDIVLPEELEPEPDSGETDLDDDTKPDEKQARRRRQVKDGKGRAEKRRRRKLHKRTQRVFGRLSVERGTMLAGAVIVLGVAMAITLYGARGNGSAGAIGRLGLAGLAGATERWLSTAWF
jgi:hypothetical protein